MRNDARPEAKLWEDRQCPPVNFDALPQPVASSPTKAWQSHGQNPCLGGGDIMIGSRGLVVKALDWMKSAQGHKGE